MNTDNPIVFFKDTYVPLADAKISILTHALHYGTGVFEGIRGYWSATRHEMYLFRPAEHYTRWKQNCGLLRMDLAHTEAPLTTRSSFLKIAMCRSPMPRSAF